jgi:hypothetical protein
LAGSEQTCEYPLEKRIIEIEVKSVTKSKCFGVKPIIVFIGVGFRVQKLNITV